VIYTDGTTESNTWQKRCVFRPDIKTGKEQGARYFKPTKWKLQIFSTVYHTFSTAEKYCSG